MRQLLDGLKVLIVELCPTKMVSHHAVTSVEHRSKVGPHEVCSVVDAQVRSPSDCRVGKQETTSFGSDRFNVHHDELDKFLADCLPLALLYSSLEPELEAVSCCLKQWLLTESLCTSL